MTALRIVAADAFRCDLRTRMPFRYGIATVTELPHAFVRVTIEIDGRTVTGVAADHLAPKWFTKDPATTPEEDIAGMARVIRRAMETARGLTGATPWAIWRELYARQADWGASENLAPLLTNFGVSLVERAMIDAFCRAKGRPFHLLLHEGVLDIPLGEIHPELAGQTTANLLPATPLDRILARHTVGLSDPLTDAEIAPEARLNDGLPQSLEACIAVYGLRHFKLKIGGDPVLDAARVAEIVSVIAARVRSDNWAFSIDGNESYKTLADLRAFWEAARAEPSLRSHLESSHLLFVEQPLHRDIALSDEAGAAFAEWPGHPPIIIDESDATLESLPRALALGYAGTSHKNCKGVFKGIANACLLAYRRRTQPGLASLLSGEDLSNVGPVALPEDLAVQAALGIESVERNGQHYFRGMAALPRDIQEQALRGNPDLYQTVVSPAGNFTALAITEGYIRLGSVNAAPFGAGFDFDPESAGFAQPLE